MRTIIAAFTVAPFLMGSKCLVDRAFLKLKVGYEDHILKLLTIQKC